MEITEQLDCLPAQNKVLYDVTRLLTKNFPKKMLLK